MVLDNDRAIFMVLKNIKKKAPYDMVDASTYEKETGDKLMGIRHGKENINWDCVVWNRDIKQMFLLTCGTKAKKFIDDVDAILSNSSSKQRIICDSTYKHTVNSAIKKIDGEWLFDLSTQSGILYIEDIYVIYGLSSREEGVVFRFYQGKIKSKELPLFCEGILHKEQKRQIVTDATDVSGIISQTDINSICGTWLRVLFFLEFAEVETKIVNRVTRKIKVGNEKVLNNTEFQFEIIDSNYYTNIIRTEGFGVQGHWRYQRVGQGRMNKKLIWIKDFQKEGYQRKAKILKDQTNVG